MDTGRIGSFIAPDLIDDGRRQRAEHWRAVHRRPDVPPLPPQPERAAAHPRWSIARVARWVARPRAGAWR